MAFSVVNKRFLKYILMGIFWVVLTPLVNAQKMNVCNIYGTVHVTEDPEKADFVVFQEESEAFADLTVFREDNRLFADQSGLWFFTDAINFANFVIYYTDDKDLADFSVFWIETPSFAGCQ